MHAHDERDQFSPPQPPGRMRAVTLAVLVHAALIAALTMGVNWTTTADQPAVEAEIWDSVPKQAAPAEVAPPPPPVPTEPPPPPVAVAPPPPPPPPQPRAQDKPDTREADIAIEREKKRLEQEKRERAEQQERDKRERERREKLEAEKKDRLEQERKERLQKEKDKEREKEREKEHELKEKQAEQKRAELKKQADEKRKSEADAKRRADAQAKELDRQRAENMRRLQGLAGATGGENATGKDKVSSGPSGSYGGKVAAKVKPNIVYPDAISGNPRAVVEVRAAPDGTIVGKKLIQSSGNKAWDDAVLRALEKTETLPRDVDGRVPSSLEISFRPQD